MREQWEEAPPMKHKRFMHNSIIMGLARGAGAGF